MKKIFFALVLSACFINTYAQVSGNVNYAAEGNYNYNNNTNTTAYTNLPNAQIIPNSRYVILDVQILSNQKANAYIAIFNLTQMGPNAAETNKLLTDRYNGFAQEIQNVGVPKSDIYLDMVSFVPVFEYEKEKKLFSKTYNEVPKGFQMQQNIHVKYTDANMLGKIIAVATKYEIYDLVRVDYIVENQEAVYVEMREKAVAHLNKEIELYAEKMGVELESGYRTIAEDKKVVFPNNRYSSYAAFSNVSLGGVPEKGKVLDMYKPQTQYYDRMPYDDFDIIINPVVVEPAVQFMYDMKVQIVLKEPTPAQKDYFWLTPDGDVVPVKLK